MQYMQSLGKGSTGALASGVSEGVIATSVYNNNKRALLRWCLLLRAFVLLKRCDYIKGDILHHQVRVGLAVTSRFENQASSDITGGRVHPWT